MEAFQETFRQKAPGVALHSLGQIYKIDQKSQIARWTLGLLLFLILFLFLPWTQNIRTRGAVTALDQEGRTQQLNAVIGGRVVKWYIKEGQYVNAGDTLAQLAEIKDAYLDPQLLQRTETQIQAKKTSLDAYGIKIAAADAQTQALQAGRSLKLQQLENKWQQIKLKMRSDSMDLIAAQNDLLIAGRQLERQRALRDSGLASLQQVEQRTLYYQNAQAKCIAAEIKYSNTKTDLLNITVERGSAAQEYAEKIAKTQGERATAQSDRATGEGEITKLQSQYASYNIRAGHYYITAPQSGQVIGITRQGLNEIIKEGEPLLRIVPQKSRHAVALFVRPRDLPLISRGQSVRFVFDGYPAMVFSGWPTASSGLFDGKVVAIEAAASDNGMFRVLVAEDNRNKPWPPQLGLGSGAEGIMLLQNVPIWYELWRNINGFPPEFYQSDNSNSPKADARKK